MSDADDAAAATAVVLVVFIVVVAMILAVTLSAPPPVDYVVTWVDGSDAEWRAAARAAVAAEPDAHSSHTSEREPVVIRPGDRDELYYNLRGALVHAPWLRKVFVVTQRPHVPPFLHDLPHAHKIHVIHHDEFFDTDVTTPTYNSNVIESQLVNIPGLAEHFILSNDDCMIVNPMRRSDFFAKDGTPRVPYKLAEPAARVWPPARTLLNISTSLKLPSQEHIPAHVMIPVRKSHLRGLKRACAPWLKKLKPVRMPTDFPMYYMTVQTGATHPVSPSIRFKIYFSKEEFMREPESVLGNLHMMCINAGFDAPEVQEKFLRVLFPNTP